MTDNELTPEEKALHEQLLAEFMDSRYFPTPHMFAARAEIANLRARIAELEAKFTKKTAKGEKGSPAVAVADKSEL